MSVRKTLLAATTLSIVAIAMSPASAQTLRYANQGDLKSLDPYTLNETTTHAHLGQVYEGLIARDHAKVLGRIDRHHLDGDQRIQPQRYRVAQHTVHVPILRQRLCMRIICA